MLFMQCDYVCRKVMHAEGGPLKELVQTLLSRGKRNMRLASATVLHLSKLFLASPAVALYYQNDLLQLMLADSAANHPSSGVTLACSHSTSSLAGCCYSALPSSPMFAGH